MNYACIAENTLESQKRIGQQWLRLSTMQQTGEKLNAPIARTNPENKKNCINNCFCTHPPQLSHTLFSWCIMQLQTNRNDWTRSGNLNESLMLQDDVTRGIPRLACWQLFSSKFHADTTALRRLNRHLLLGKKCPPMHELRMICTFAKAENHQGFDETAIISI